MFWRKSDFSTGLEYFKNGRLLCSFEMNEERPEWKGKPLATRKELNKLNNKLDLILKELGKEYVAESSKTEPAKLVDTLESEADNELEAFLIRQAMSEIEKAYEKPKKKRGRPKKK